MNILLSNLIDISNVFIQVNNMLINVKTILRLGCGIVLVILVLVAGTRMLDTILVQQVVKVMPDEGKPCNTTASTKDTSCM